MENYTYAGLAKMITDAMVAGNVSATIAGEHLMQDPRFIAYPNFSRYIGKIVSEINSNNF